MPQSGGGRIQRLLPRDLLEQLYVADGRSAKWIAERYGAHRGTVARLIREYGLVKPTGSPGVAARIDPDELYRLHNLEKVSMEEIGLRFGVSPAAAWGWMRRYAIPRRPRTRRQAAATPPPEPWISQDALLARWGRGETSARIAEATGLEREVVQRRLEAAGVMSRRQAAPVPVGGPDDPLSKKLLEKLYLEQHMSPWEIAKATGATERQVDYRLTRYAIPRHQSSERRTLIKDLDPETLRELYREQQRSDLEIAAIYQVSAGHVGSKRRRSGIETRPGAVRTSGGRTPLSKEVLEQLHVREGLTAEQIAVKLGYLRPTGEASIGRVRHALERHGLNIAHSRRVIAPQELRRLYEQEHLDEAGIGARLGWRTPHGKPSVVHIRKLLVDAGVARRRADRTPNPDTAEILRLYREERLTEEQIAEHFGWYDKHGAPAAGLVRRRLRRAGVAGLSVNRFPTAGRQQAVELYTEKQMTLREVAEHLGWYSASGTPQVAAVQKALREAGVNARPTGPRPRG